jgi:hypothetical protein
MIDIRLTTLRDELTLSSQRYYAIVIQYQILFPRHLLPRYRSLCPLPGAALNWFPETASSISALDPIGSNPWGSTCSDTA